MILGLCGPKGSGKTSLGKKLNLSKNFLELSFAEPLKRMLNTLILDQGATLIESRNLIWGENKDQPSIYLNNQTPRLAMQTLGTEWGRKLIDNDLWIGVWKRTTEYLYDSNIVVDDLRFLNEAQAIRELNGKIIRIERDGYDPSQHISEREYLLIQPDLTILNNSTPEEMYNKILPHLNQWLKEEK